jgi:chromosome segregation ATPase
MSEAQNHNNEQNLPQPNEANQTIESSADLTDSNPSPTMADNPAGSEESAGNVSGQIADALTWQSDLDVAELVTLSQSLQQQNNDLLSHIEQLEKLLDECHSALQLQMKRNQGLETRITQQTEELTSTQEQATRLFRELEASHQVAQRQQILIETLNQQLENSQEQVAQLERECALAQQKSNEQAYSLSQS